VPYEYGRVKEDGPVTVRAACWLDGVARADLPEYFWRAVPSRRVAAARAGVWVAPFA
jgi:hypothetical protein